MQIYVIDARSRELMLSIVEAVLPSDPEAIVLGEGATLGKLSETLFVKEFIDYPVNRRTLVLGSYYNSRTGEFVAPLGAKNFKQVRAVNPPVRSAESTESTQDGFEEYVAALRRRRFLRPWDGDIPAVLLPAGVRVKPECGRAATSPVLEALAGLAAEDQAVFYLAEGDFDHMSAIEFRADEKTTSGEKR